MDSSLAAAPGKSPVLFEGFSTRKWQTRVLHRRVTVKSKTRQNALVIVDPQLNFWPV